MRVFDAVGKILGFLIVGYVVVVFAMVILHMVRSGQHEEEFARVHASFDVLDTMEANGFSSVEFIDTKQFIETRRCYDFKIAAIDSSGKAIVGHFIQCNTIDGGELVNYMVNDFCEEGVTVCPAAPVDYDDCAEESDCE